MDCSIYAVHQVATYGGLLTNRTRSSLEIRTVLFYCVKIITSSKYADVGSETNHWLYCTVCGLLVDERQILLISRTSTSFQDCFRIMGIYGNRLYSLTWSVLAPELSQKVLVRKLVSYSVYRTARLIYRTATHSLTTSYPVSIVFRIHEHLVTTTKLRGKELADNISRSGMRSKSQSKILHGLNGRYSHRCKGETQAVLTLRRLMSYIYIYIYIYGAPILDVSRSHTTTQHSR